MNKVLMLVLAILGLVALVAVMALYNAFVLATLWAWFVVPLGAAQIGIAHAYGLSLIPTVILTSRGLYSPEDKRTESYVAAMMLPAAALLFGWIAVGFM